MHFGAPAGRGVLRPTDEATVLWHVRGGLDTMVHLSGMLFCVRHAMFWGRQGAVQEDDTFDGAQFHDPEIPNKCQWYQINLTASSGTWSKS